jgi:hypothetical protein
MQRHAHRPWAGVVRGAVFAAAFLAAAFHVQHANALASTIPGTAADSCDLENIYCDFHEQSKVAASGGRRSAFVQLSTSGSIGIKLTTQSGDDQVNGSGTWERNDLAKPPHASYCNPGQEEWWAFSILFPNDYVFPPGPGAGIVMDFHHTGSSGQANYEIQTIPGIGLRARGYGGPSVNGGKYDALIPDPYGAVANVTKNTWYNFVLHVKWSPNGDGLMEGWLNGRKYQSYTGPTLYSGMSCYLKLANYHAPFGQSSSVVFDRIVRGRSAAAVTLMALEGVPGTGTVATTNDIFADARLFAMQQYRDFLEREGDAAGIDFYASRIDSGALTRGQAIESFFASHEFQGTFAPVVRLYFAYFLRYPDYAGLRFWIDYYKAGHSLDEISNLFAASPEFAGTYGGLTNAGFVTLAYNNVLGRAPDSGGLAYWRNQLDTKAMTRGQVMLALSESAEYRASSFDMVYVTMMYAGMLRRSPDQAGFDFWVGYLNAGHSGIALIEAFLAAPEYRARVLP